MDLNELKKAFDEIYGLACRFDIHDTCDCPTRQGRLIAVARAALNREEHGASCNLQEGGEECTDGPGGRAHQWHDDEYECRRCGLSRAETVCDCGKAELDAALIKLVGGEA